MRPFIELTKRALKLPPKEVAIKASRLFVNSAKTRYELWQDRQRGTYTDLETLPVFRQLLVAPKKEEVLKFFPDCLKYAEKYRNHEFNLLGSSWRKVYRGMKAPGILGVSYSMNGSEYYIINKANRKHSSSVAKLLPKTYELI
ncbi:MAG: hypothetical protein KDD34_09870, partial [Bdellovibrionales bacterium]|nr:hypothetical protein [Bdellovibrionales bacterium]